MTVTVQDVTRLAQLARIRITDAEATALAVDMDRILAYVQDVDRVSEDIPRDTNPALRNVFREDVATNVPGAHTEDIASQFFAREENALRVPKIL